MKTLVACVLTVPFLLALDYPLLEVQSETGGVDEFANDVVELEGILGLSSIDAALQECRLDVDGLSWYDRRGSHSFELVIPSGFIHYRDLDRFGQTPVDPGAVDVPDGDEAIEEVEELARLLDTSGFLDIEELSVDQATVARHMMDRSGEHVSPNDIGPFHIETIVTLPRTVAGIPVSGQYVRAWLGDSGRIHGLDIRWRGGVLGTSVAVAGDLAGARVELERKWVDPRGELVMLGSGLAYVDLDESRVRNSIAPAWAFAYRVDSEVPGAPTPEFARGKEQMVLLSNVDSRYERVAIWRDEEFE